MDEAHQVITAADVTTNASDALNYTTMLDQSAQNTSTHPKQALVDAGYCSETNLEAARDRQLACGTDTFMATGRSCVAGAGAATHPPTTSASAT